MRTRLLVDKTEVVAEHGVVAAMHPLAAEAGAQILAQGGNAVDAAITTAFALGVVEPFMSGAAGHGAMVLHLPGGESEVIDFTTRAPRAATPESFKVLEQDGSLGTFPAVEGDANHVDHRAVPVPTAGVGLLEAHTRHGSLPLDTLLAPAIYLAEDGFDVDWYVSMMITAHLEKLWRFPESRKTYLIEGYRPPAPRLRHEHKGDALVQPKLAATYRTLVRDGVRSFTHGELGERIVGEMERRGGLLAREDLETYTPLINRGERLRYRRWELVGVPGPTRVSALFQMLNILEGLQTVPSQEAQQPNRSFLTWHNENVYVP